MINIKTSKAYKRSLKKLLRSGRFDKKSLQGVIDKIARGEKIEESRKDHQLNGRLSYLRECHIESDLLLVYETNEDILHLVNIGSHSDLFG